MTTMLAYTRFEILRTLRNTRFLVVTLVMPAVVYLLFDQVQRTAGPYLMVALAGFSMIGAALSANCASLPAERASGWRRQLRATPLSGTGWVTARVVQALIAVIPGLAVIALCGLLVGHVALSAGQWAAFPLLVVAAAIPFGFLGLLLGEVLDAQSAQPLQGLVTMLLSFGGGLFVPLSSFPAALRTVAGLLPPHLFFRSGQLLINGQAPAVADLAGLAAWSLGLAVVTLLVWARRDGRLLAARRSATFGAGHDG